MMGRFRITGLPVLTLLAACTEAGGPIINGVVAQPPARYASMGLDILVPDPRDSAPPGPLGVTISGYLNPGILANGAFRRIANDTLTVGSIVLTNPSTFSAAQFQYVSREPIAAGSRPLAIRLPAVEKLPAIGPFNWGLRGRLDPDTVDVAAGADPILHITPELSFTPVATFHGWSAEFTSDHGTTTADGTTELTFPWALSRSALPNNNGTVTVRVTLWVNRADPVDPPADTYNSYVRIGQSFRWVLRLH